MPIEVKFREETIKICAALMVKWIEEVDKEKLQLIVYGIKKLIKEAKEDDLVFKVGTFMTNVLSDKENNDPIDNLLALILLRYHYENITKERK